VVDNASTDGSVDGLEERFPWVEVVRSRENLGFAAGNNLAVEMAAGCEYVCLLNPDAFAEPTWLEELLRAAEENAGEFSFFASRLVDAEDSDRLDGTGDLLHVGGLAWRRDHGKPVANEHPACEVFSPCAAAALYRRDAFVAVGGFDEDYFCYGEDTDLSFRLRLTGHRCLYVPTAVVHHLGSVTSGRESDFTLYHSYRNLNWTFVKNMPGRLLALYLPQLLLVNLLLLGAFTLRRRPGVVLRAQRDALGGLRATLRKRRAIQAARLVEPEAIRGVMERGVGAYLTNFMRAFEARARSQRVPPAFAGGPTDRAVVVARNVLSNFGAQAWLLVVAIATTPFVVHELGVSAYGVYALVLTLIGYFAFLDLGLGVATVKYVSEFAGRGDTHAVGRVLRTAIGAYLLLGLVGATAIALSASFVATQILDVERGLTDVTTTALLLAGVGFAVNMPLAVFGAVPSALQRIVLANTLSVGFATVGVGGTVTLLALGYGLPAILLFSVAVSAIALVAFFVVAKRLLPGVSLRPGLERSQLRLLTGFGVMKFANQMASQTVYHLDKFLVGAFLGVGAVAFFVIPGQIAHRLTQVVANVSVAFLPAASELHGQGDRERFAELYFRAAKVVALVVFPIGLVLVVFATPLLDLWLGADFARESAWPLRLLAIGYMLSALGTIPAVACDAVGRPGVTTAFSVAAAVLNVSLSLVFIPLYGITGAAAVNLVQSLVTLPVFLVYVHRRVVGLRLAELAQRSLLRPLAASALAGAVMVAFLPVAGSLAGLALAGVVSAALYVGFALMLGAYDLTDRDVARRSLRRGGAPRVEVAETGS
jgi:GT2 family glycosyltransferase/O-antigen/teichoic acid export membrane protein